MVLGSDGTCSLDHVYKLKEKVVAILLCCVECTF